MARVHIFYLLLALTLLVVEQSQGCSWPGHCAGARCNDYNDCSDNLICDIGCGGGQGLGGAHGGSFPKCCQSPRSSGKRRRRNLVEILADHSSE